MASIASAKRPARQQVRKRATVPATAHEHQRIGVIDLGSNTARLVIYAYDERSFYKLTDQVRQRVRLAEGFSEGEHPCLQPAPIERAIETLHLFHSLCIASHVPHIIAVATSAVRDAENQADFLRQVKRRARLDLRVLNGDEEAYYGYLGVINTLDVQHGLLFDLGGGSIEITQVAARRLLHSASLPLGVVRMAERFSNGADGSMSRKQLSELSDFVAEQVAALEWLTQEQAQHSGQLIGMGGTARALAKLDQEAHGYLLERLHGYVLSAAALDDLIEQMSGRSEKELLALPGMNPDRADVILPGALVVRALMRVGQLDTFTVSGAGLREGVFFTEFMGNGVLSHGALSNGHSPATSPIIRDVRAFSIENVARRYDAWNPHARHVRKLSLELFDQLQPVHGYGAWERGMLDAAALLHDIGYAISYFDHDEHSQYLILNSDLTAYTHRELAVLGLLVRYHRKGDVAVDRYAALLEKGDEARITLLAALLRLAEYLERGRRQSVRDLTCNVGASEVVIAAHTRGDAAIELWEASRNVGLLEQALTRTVKVVKA